MRRITMSQEQLRELYEKERLTTYQVAKRLGCCQATVWKRLIDYGITRRTPWELRANVPSREELIDLYTNKRLSTWEIARRHGYSRSTVHRKLGEFSIRTRDRAESHMLYPRRDFSGDLVEKAYLTGFRIGDLGVRKVYPRSNTICVATGSTMKEQIRLVRRLFEKYGHVWSKEARGKINVQVSLNESFDFLLGKGFPQWVEKDRSTFFSFLAGFTDAEGTLSISRGMAFYSLGNYDDAILFAIHKNLNRFGIECNIPRSDTRRGTLNNEGYAYKKDYWTLRIHKKDALSRLFSCIEPHIKHEKKIEDLKRASQNVEERNRR